MIIKGASAGTELSLDFKGSSPSFRCSFFLTLYISREEFSEDHLEGLSCSLTYDPHIQPEIGITDIKSVKLVTMKDAFKVLGRTTVTFYLSQSGNTWFNRIPGTYSYEQQMKMYCNQNACVVWDLQCSFGPSAH